jgi:hypothetical protein
MELTKKTKILLSCSPLVLLAGLCSCVGGVLEFYMFVSLLLGGVEVPGKVVGRNEYGKLEAKTYYLTVSYVPKPGLQPMRRGFQVFKARFDQAKQATDVRVLALPNNPSGHSELVGGAGSTGFDNCVGGVVHFIGGVGAMIASFFMFKELFSKDGCDIRKVWNS